MHHGEFCAVTLREFDLITSARIRSKNADIEARRVLNQELAILVTHAFHDPKKMPDFTKAGTNKQQNEQGGAHALEKLRAGLIGMHVQSKVKGR